MLTNIFIPLLWNVFSLYLHDYGNLFLLLLLLLFIYKKNGMGVSLYV